MLRPLGYVLLNYVTRPMVWVLGGIYIVVLGFSMFQGIREYRAGQPHSTVAAYPEAPMLRGRQPFSTNRPQALQSLDTHSSASLSALELDFNTTDPDQDNAESVLRP